MHCAASHHISNADRYLFDQSAAIQKFGIDIKEALVLGAFTGQRKSCQKGTRCRLEAHSSTIRHVMPSPTPSFRGNKAALPSKPCVACGRTMSWRRRWARTWAEVKFCSDACRRAKDSRG